MDHEDTAEAVLARHQPIRWRTFFGSNRCRSCRGSWPCNHWHNARDRRDRVPLDHAALERIAGLVAQINSLPSNRERLV